MTSFLNKGKVTKLECNVDAQPPETKGLVTYAGIAYSTSTTDQHYSDLSILHYRSNVYIMDSQLS